MVSLVLLSAGAAFASSDDAVVSEINDEIAIEESVLAVEDDGATLEAGASEVYQENASASTVVTNDTFFDYFDEDGALLSNVTADELEFDGDFSGVNVTTINIDRSIKFIGNNATFDGVSFSIGASNVTIDGFTLTQTNSFALIDIYNVDNVTLSNNVIYYQAVEGQDSYAILANVVTNLKLLNNTVTYVGNTYGTKINNAVYVGSNVFVDDDDEVHVLPAANILMEGNKFNITIPSVDAGYDEDYNQVLYSEGIVFFACENLTFTDNEVNVTYNNASGSYDTFYALDVKSDAYTFDFDDDYNLIYPVSSKNVIIGNNTFNVNGHKYTYALGISAQNFEVYYNTINVNSDDYYANAIAINGPSSNGAVYDNGIFVKAEGAAYGIYSYQWAGPIEDMFYSNNFISVKAYAACAMEIVETNPIIDDNFILAYGNHTTGMAVNAAENGTISNNTIMLQGTNVGNESTGDSLIHVESTGISLKGDAIVDSNIIVSTAVGVNLLQAGDIVLNNNNITVVAIGEVDNYAILVDEIDSLNLTNNEIEFYGATDGEIVTNGIYIYDTDDVVISDNNISIGIPSAYVHWNEVPASSGNWVSTPISEGIVIDTCDSPVFKNNNVTVYYNNVTGFSDTIYAIDVKDSYNPVISGNIIAVDGHTYTYGIVISAENFNITDNLISVASDEYYANGIDVEGPAYGLIDRNMITVEGVESAYGIYSGMNGQEVYGKYTNNTILGNAYNVFGMSLGDAESYLEDNSIGLTGNYTTGIAYKGSNLTAVGNIIALNSSEQGNLSVWESFGVESVGIKVIGNASITKNYIVNAQGKGISVTDGSAVLSQNNINLVANDDADAYAIYATDMPDLVVFDNTISYKGATQGSGINNALYIGNVTGNIVGNKFNLSLVSSYVPWFEIPASSGNWVSFPVSEGIVIDSSDNVIFEENIVSVVYTDVVGGYDTIYAISVKDSENTFIYNNNITALGHTYIYGIQVNGNEFSIINNTIEVESDIYYANGIDIEGPATGEVTNNNISVAGIVSAYAIYSGMNGQNVSAAYFGNTINAEAYNVFGFSLGDVESSLLFNEINLYGNYTTGIAFVGNNLTVSANVINLNSSEQGNESIWESLGVETVGIKVLNGNADIMDNEINAQGTGIYLVTDGNVSVSNNTIDIVANEDADAYAICADSLIGLNVTDNVVRYTGKTQGNGINNAVYLYNVTDAKISDNEFELFLVSSYVPWFEIPASSGNWVSFPVSEGIVIDESNNVVLVKNEINVEYSDVVGFYDTIYAVSVKNSDIVVITDNLVNVSGHTYSYAIQASGDGLDISNNTIISVSDNYYANAIDIEGPAVAIIENNTIDVSGVESAYAIYSGMNGQNVSSIINNNTINADAYNVFGLSLGDVESIVLDNYIALSGNYTTGIAYRGDSLNASRNIIFASGSNVGDLPVWEAFGVESIGIKVVKGESEILNNSIVTSGDYAIDLRNTTSIVKGNYLLGKKYAGNESVANATNAEVINNTPVIEDKLDTIIIVYGFKASNVIIGVLTDEYLIPIPNDKVSYSINGVTGEAETDENGTFTIAVSCNGDVEISFAEDSYFFASNTTFTVYNVIKTTPVINITNGDAEVGKDVNVTISIPGATGNVSVIVDNVETVVALDEGTAIYTISEISTGEHNILVIYEGDDVYAPAHNSSTIFLEGYTSTFTNITISGDYNITATLLNSLGDPIANATITYTIGDVNGTTITDENGVFSLIGVNGATITIEYNGTDIILPTSEVIILKDLAKITTGTTIVGANFTEYTVDFDIGERGQNFTVQLTDINGVPLANKTVYIGYNGKTLVMTTDANGNISKRISLRNSDLLTFAVVFLGDEDYNATMASYLITVNKKPTTISASAKSYKASASTKKYTVTLKTSKCSSEDGKVYLKSGKKITLKINGKTYTAKTNAKGQATFSLKITKKGKFKSVIKFAGDNTYEASSKSVTITIK